MEYFYVNNDRNQRTTFSTKLRPVTDITQLKEGTFMAPAGWQPVFTDEERQRYTTYTSVLWQSEAHFHLGSKCF